MQGQIAEHMVQKYKLGDPTKSETNLGPVCSVASAERIKKQVQDAGGLYSEALTSRAHARDGSPGGREGVDPRAAVP